MVYILFSVSKTEKQVYFKKYYILQNQVSAECPNFTSSS